MTMIGKFNIPAVIDLSLARLAFRSFDRYDAGMGETKVCYS
jgi:hypothetical protein